MENEKYIFIIDTNKPSVTSEKGLCAFITGITHKDHTDIPEKREFYGNHPDMISEFENIIEFISDELGNESPSSIWETDDSGLFNSVAIFFKNKPTKEIIEFLTHNSKEFLNRNSIRFEKSRLIKNNLL